MSAFILFLRGAIYFYCYFREAKNMINTPISGISKKYINASSRSEREHFYLKAFS